MTRSRANNVYSADIRDHAGENPDWKNTCAATPYQISAIFTDEADASLDLFRNHMLQYFPFIILPGEYLMIEGISYSQNDYRRIFCNDLGVGPPSMLISFTW